MPRFNLIDNRLLRFVTLCSLYVSQGLPQGFINIALKNHLYERGHSVDDVGKVLSMISLPWALKFVWGPVIDRFGIASMGKRRPWLILSQAMTVLVIFGLATMPDIGTNLQLLGWSILAMNIFTSIQDVSTDSLAVDIVKENDRGKINGFMYGSSYLGSFLGGIFIGQFLAMKGGSVQLALGVMGCCVLLISLLPLLLRERHGEKLLPWTKGSSQLRDEQKHVASARELFGTLGRSFARPVAIFAAVLAIGAHVGNLALVQVGSEHFIKARGWGSEAYTQLESSGLWFSLGGAMCGGFIADKLGAKRTVILAGSLIAIDWIAFSRLEPWWDSRWLIITNMYFLAVLMGIFSVSMFTLFMNVSNKRVAASQFTAYMAMLNLSMFIGNRLAGWVKESVPSVPSAYLASGLFHLALMVFVFFTVHVHPKKAERQSP
jgi:PAT family beta-lactamase induction signal transducer AmpG